MHIVRAPDNRLRVKTRPIKKITPDLLKTLEQMEKLTLSFKDPEGVGLASTQIGQPEQFFIIKNKDNTFTKVFNPKILGYSKQKKVYLEGCLSIPDYWGEVERFLRVDVEYTNEKGEVVKKKLKGVDAWIFQHEFDHLNGVLFIDLVMKNRGRLFKVVGRDRVGAEIFEEIKI